MLAYGWNEHYKEATHVMVRGFMRGALSCSGWSGSASLRKWSLSWELNHEWEGTGPDSGDEHSRQSEWRVQRPLGRKSRSYQGLKEDTRGWFPPLGITVSLCSSAPNCTLDPNNHYWPRTSHMPPHSCRNSEHVAFSQRFITLVLYLNQWLSLLSLWGVLMTLISLSTLGVE